jgi:phosphoglycerate-specific signal transduction histidine kinase
MSIVPQGPDTQNSLSELPNLLKTWMKLQEEIVTLNAEISQRKKHSKTLKETILRIMNSNKVAALNVSRGVISHRVKETLEPVNNSYLMKQCTAFFEGDEAKAKNLIEYLENRREVKQHHDLKLVLPKTEGDELSRRS